MFITDTSAMSRFADVLLCCVPFRQLCGFASEGIEAESRAASVPNRHAFKSECGGGNFLDDLVDRGFAFFQWMLKMVVEIARHRFAFHIEMSRPVGQPSRSPATCRSHHRRTVEVEKFQRLPAIEARYDQVRCHAGGPKAPFELCDTKSTTRHGKQEYG